MVFYYGVYTSNTSLTPGTALANGVALVSNPPTSSGLSTYTLYGLIQGNGANTGISAGTYTDVINITITY
ncbi:hypothetical protein [Arsenophonus endosymbiont of Aleurodicus floccissimus]|uniref:hypothetical protein n=1 Tax=Arsenophonus endosymbiont of Aleurodicus floccissimus TaxID=2152761 RepID=UPI000E6B3800|nr:hypothetical protein [Arsenophonus endosymbiont of Aleurodicus floccissimus]